MLFRSIRAFPLTFWFLWTSPAFFRCPRLHPFVTVRSEPLLSRPQYLQHSDINILRIQLPNNRHRKTERPIPSTTQPRMARNCITRTSTRRLKFLPHEHALHAPPRSAGTCHAPHAPYTRQSTRTHAPHAPAAASLPATSALGDVTLPHQHTSAVDSDR